MSLRVAPLLKQHPLALHLWISQREISEVNAVLARVQPREILLPEKLIQKPDLFEVWADWNTALNTLPDSRLT